MVPSTTRKCYEHTLATRAKKVTGGGGVAWCSLRATPLKEISNGRRYWGAGAGRGPPARAVVQANRTSTQKGTPV